MGKGDNRRPKDIDDETFAINWSRIFGEGGKGYLASPPERVGQAPGVEGAEFAEDKVEAGS